MSAVTGEDPETLAPLGGSWAELKPIPFLGLNPVTRRADETMSGQVSAIAVDLTHDESGNLVDDSFLAIDKFLDELLWMAETLRYGRENVTIGGPG